MMPIAPEPIDSIASIPIGALYVPFREYAIRRGPLYTDGITSCVAIAMRNIRNDVLGLFHLHALTIGKGEYPSPINDYLYAYIEEALNATPQLETPDMEAHLVGGGYDQDVEQGTGLTIRFDNALRVKRHIESFGISAAYYSTDRRSAKTLIIAGRGSLTINQDA